MSLRSLSCLLAISCSTLLHAEDVPTFAGATPGTLRSISIPTVDISDDAARHVVIARGTEKEYQGHCDTVLMADGRTMFTAWCMNHAGHLGPLARSDDAGLTWPAPLSTPPDWQLVKLTTPVLHRLTDPQGIDRLFIFGGCDFPGNLRSAFSTDLGKTWSPMKELGLVGEVAPKSILSFDGGKRLIMWSDRRDPKNAKDLHPVVWQSESLDGGLTWSKERVILAVPGQWAQPSVTRSDDGKQLVMLMRENTRQHHSLYSISTDDARTWCEPKELPAALTGDRHVIKHAPDGRLVIAFRDMAKTSRDYGHYVGWVGTFDDIVNRREGQYRIKLLHNTKRSPTDAPGTGNTDCGYSDLELLGDGTLIATTYIQYAAGPEKSSVVSTRFRLSETDALAKQPPASAGSLLPANWDPALAGDIVMQRLVRVSAPQVKGAHDAEFVCVGERAYIVEHDNDVSPGHGAGVAMYCVLTVVNMQTLQVEKMHPMAKAGQAFANITLPEAQVFVPRIIRKDEHTLRTYFCSQPAKAQAVTWYRDFDLRTQTFEDGIHKAKLKTAAGTFDMEPRHFHADAAASGFKRPGVNQGLYIFDSFKEFDGKRYIALNNFPGKQNALALLHDDFATFEIIGHYNEPQSQQLSESAVNRLPDGTWMAIVRNDAGNYHFTSSQDGKTWTAAEPKPFVPNGLNSKPTFDHFGGVYYLGWQENTKIQNCGRSVFNVDISRDGKTWERKYRFESPHSFQYPTFHEHEGTLWLTVTQSDHGGTTDRIMFGKLESVGQFEPQTGQTHAQGLVPSNWDPALAGDVVMERLINTSAPRVKGTHDAEFICVGDKTYLVTEANDQRAGESSAWPFIYVTMSIVNLKTLEVEKVIDFARSEQAFENETLPFGQCFVPRVLRKDAKTLRCYFTSQDPGKRQSQMWYIDFDLERAAFENKIFRAKLKTAAGTFDMQPQYFHADAAAQGFRRPARDAGLFIFDSFKQFDGKTYVALNNFPVGQNALALLHDDLVTFEVLGHYNEPQSQQLSESAVNKLPDGTWMAICRNDKGNYHFTTSPDGKTWSIGKEMPFVNGSNSKPTFDKFGSTYYLGWQDAELINGDRRTIFNFDISRDGKNWERKYRFVTPHSFQYPALHEHQGVIWLSVTQGKLKDRIMFGKLEDMGQFESLAGKKRIEWPTPLPPNTGLMKKGEKLFTDREYVIDEMPAEVSGLPFYQTSIEKFDVEVTKPGTLFALTPTIRPKAASQEEALKKAGFTKVDVPEAQLFSGEINRVSLYRKTVKAGERLKFKKMVLLILKDGVAVHEQNPNAPVVITNPGAEFQDDARPGGMIIGMDRTPKGRIWGCWTGTGDKKDGYFLLATSDDDGSTWSKPRLAVGARTDVSQRLSGALVGNLWTDPKGRLWLFFDQQLGNADGLITNWSMVCSDPDAAEPTWSEPARFAEGCTLNKPTVLKNGDWLLPVSDWQKKTARVFASTNQGQTWKERGSLQFPDWQFDEHMTVELKDGRLWMLARTSGQPHESFSTDGGATWSAPQLAATVQNVSSRFFLRRLTSGRILLVKNGSPAERLPKRTHMSAWLSEDEGQTWKGGLMLDERNSVSYPDGFESPDGLIHVLYDWNRHTDAEILMAKFREEDILAAKLVSKDAKLLMLVNKATGPKPEKLYNGIELPDVWPPKFRDPNSGEPMEVPYLKRPLKSIPIDVGRQLFVDDFLIHKTTLKRTFHQAKKFEGNPVFKAETERELGKSTEGERGEEATTFTGQGGVFYDPTEKLFKMFYVAGWRGPLSLATSPDMKTWTRHGQLLPEGLRWTGPQLATGGSDNCVWLDLNAKTPAERIKYLTCWLHVPKEQRPQGFMHSLHVSDGKTFSDAVTTSIAADDYCSFFYNPFREKWVFSIKRGTSRGRSRYYYESDEFLQGADWGKGVFWTSSDKLDEPEPKDRYPGGGEQPQLYSLNAVAYESLMIGMHYVHRGPKNEVCEKGKFPKLVDLELGFSRDGFHWDRPDRRGFIVGSRTEGSWDRGYLHGAAGVFVVLDDQLVFPYMGTSGIAPSGHRGMYTGGSIGLATLRRDGFASMDGTGSLTTRPVKFTGKHLFVNSIGDLTVTISDEKDKVLAMSKPHTGDSTKQRIEWNEIADLSQLAGKPVKFTFTLGQGSLYSFWVTSDEKGASNGYVGAGGPEFSGVMDKAAP